MKKLLLGVSLLVLACGGGGDDKKVEDLETEADGALPGVDVAPDAPIAPVDVADTSGTAPDTPSQPETVEDLAGDVTPDVAIDVVDPEPYTEVPETVLDGLGPSCDGCLILAQDMWDESWEPTGPEKGQYDIPWTDEGGTAWTLYFRPWMRFRVPHPGQVTKLFLYTAGGTGELLVQLSTGFPGGHYPCLDPLTGDDSYPVGKPFRMEITEEPGWREIDISGLEHSLLGYDEFFVIFDMVSEARVALSVPAEREAGDYQVYGGLITDIPGDQQDCFPSMSNFEDAEENPLVWLVRAELATEKMQEDRLFLDLGADSPGVGSHVAFGDYDNDGDEDMLCGATLWENDGAGNFQNITEAAGTAGLKGETVWGDYDNDGFRDILGVGGNGTLFKNMGDGTFADVTAESGINVDANSQGTAWVDVDGDGYLDFYSASYGLQSDGEKATRDYIFYNNGDGTFTDVTADLGVPVTPIYHHGRGICVSDYDEDGDPDIYVGNYRLDPNQLWRNKGGMDGFEDVSWDAGVKGNFASGAWGHAIGPSWGDLNGDGLFDILLPNLAHPRFWTFSDPTIVYFNLGDGTFEQVQSLPFTEPSTGIRYDETHSDSTIFDIDNDGDQDAFITSVYEGRRSYIYANDGAGHFTDLTYEAGVKHFNGWGSAAADVDGDGDMDLAAHRLFVNQHTGGHYLQIKLTGGATPEATDGFSNRDAIGAVAKVEVDGKTLARQVEGGTGAGNQSSSILHFGLGDATEASKLTVIWPSGKTTEMSDIAADQLLEIMED